MNNEATKTVKETAAVSDEKALATTAKAEVKTGGFAPVFVEAEKMFERIADLTKETTHKAYEFFQRRGGEFGRELDDWFRAESEILRSVPVEITETKDAINVRAAVSGFKPEEIEVSVKDNLLILSGETKTEENTTDENTIYSEWRSNKFCRQLNLSSEIDADKVTANLKDGVLNLTLPKIPMREATQVPVNAD